MGICFGLRRLRPPELHVRVVLLTFQEASPPMKKSPASRLLTVVPILLCSSCAYHTYNEQKPDEYQSFWCKDENIRNSPGYGDQQPLNMGLKVAQAPRHLKLGNHGYGEFCEGKRHGSRFRASWVDYFVPVAPWQKSLARDFPLLLGR